MTLHDIVRSLDSNPLTHTEKILQIVPRAPGTHEGVGDYALELAERLGIDYGRETIFAVGSPISVSGPGNFRVLAPLASISEAEWRKQNYSDIILHYVNYGYQNRGIPFRLPATLRKLRRGCGGKLVTVFHELYASGSPGQSAFWLQPLQKSIAGSIAQISDACVVSSEVMRDMLLELAPAARVSVQPVISTVGEPVLSADQFVRRDPRRWVIFGGTHLVERSLRSFLSRVTALPSSLSPHKLFVLGGKENEVIRAELNRLHGIETRYLPEIEASAASEILASCAFGWIDYFRQRPVSNAIILKSGSFAAYCAHGVIPVLPHSGSAISLNGDPLPGPYFIEEEQFNLPSDGATVAAEIYDWYRRRVSSEHLARGTARALGMIREQ